MNNPITPSPTRVRIHSHVTQSRFLHVEDALAIGKIRLFAGNYRKGQGMDDQGYGQHFIDLVDARVIFWALLGGEQGFSHKEYKGTPPTRHLDRLGAGSERRPEVAGRRNGSGNGAVSRVLSIAVKGDNVYIELKTGPGKLTPTGAITPNGPAQVEVNVTFKLHEARRMAASVLAYLQAWDVLRMMANRQMVSKPMPYTSTTLSTSLLVSATSDANGVQSEPAKPGNSISEPPVAAANGRPVTRKAPMPKANGAATRKANGQPAKASPTINGQPAKPDTARAEYLDEPGTGFAEGAGATEQPLNYGDGHMVDRGNLTEVQTFQRYMAERKAAPESKRVLLDYYRQRVQAPASVANS